jgi:hypothetical protein
MSKIVQLGDLSGAEAERRLGIANDICRHVMTYPSLAKICREEGRTGGYLSDGPADSDDPDQYLICEVAEPSPPKADRYLELCMEKPFRIGPDPNHRLSRDVENGYDRCNEKWGGGVRGHTRRGGVSFLPEQGDEILKLCYLYAIHDLTYDEVMQSFRDHPNAFEEIFYQIDFEAIDRAWPAM